jgi:hypothetical protein
MATISISKVFSELFAAPLRAVVEAEEEYLRIWIARLKVIEKVISKDKKKAVNVADLIEQYVPVVRIEGKIDTGLTMRIVGVREMRATVSAGLALGPIHASGGFGFASRTTHESVFQASTSFALSNKEFSLKDYLDAAKIAMVEPEDLVRAIKHLETDLRSRSVIAAEVVPAPKETS